MFLLQVRLNRFKVRLTSRYEDQTALPSEVEHLNAFDSQVCMLQLKQITTEAFSLKTLFGCHKPEEVFGTSTCYKAEVSNWKNCLKNYVA